jgi:hypothetical protein
MPAAVHVHLQLRIVGDDGTVERSGYAAEEESGR